MTSLTSVQRFAEIERWDPPTERAPRKFACESSTLAGIAEVRLGVQVPRKGSRPSGVSRPYLRAANVRRGHVDTTDLRSMHLSAAQADQLTLRAGDLVFVEGSGSVTEVGRAALWDGGVDGVVHQNSVVRARVEDRRLDGDFLVTWFNSRAGNAYIRRVATTTSGLFHIGAAKLGNAPVPIPPAHVQQQIVSDVQDARDAAAHAEEEATVRRLSAWATFTEQVTFATTPVSETGMAEIVSFATLDRWDTAAPANAVTSPHPMSKLSDVAELRLGTQVPRKGSRAPGTSTRYLRAANVQKGHLALGDVRTMSVTDAMVDRLRLRDGDILIVEGNSEDEVGRAAVWRGEDDLMIIQNSVIRARLGTANLLPEFVVAWFNSDAGRAYIRQQATTTSGSLWHIGVGKLAHAPIPVPPLALQRQIVEELEDGLRQVEVALSEAASWRERAEIVLESALLR